MNRIVKWIISIIDFFLFSNLYIAIASAALTIETIIFFDIPDFRFVFFVFFSTLFLYSFHRIYRLGKRSEKELKEKRHSWIRQHPVLFYSVLFLAFFALCYLILFYLQFKTIFFLLPVALVSFGYSIPFLKTDKGLVRLRDVYGLKIFLISFTLSYVTVILPIVNYYDSLPISVDSILFVFLRRMLFVFAITVPFDIRDMEYDVRNSIKTFPIIFGVNRAKGIAIGALITFSLLVVVQYAWSVDMNIFRAFALLISATISSLVILKTNSSRSEYFYLFGLEGMLLLQALLIVTQHYISGMI